MPPPPPPGPRKICHKKDGCHRLHVSQPLPYPAAGAATDSSLLN